MLRLVKFEVSGYCSLNEDQIARIRWNLEENVRKVNEELAKGADRYCSPSIGRRDDERYGMEIVCVCAGIDVEVKYEKEPAV